MRGAIIREEVEKVIDNRKKAEKEKKEQEAKEKEKEREAYRKAEEERVRIIEEKEEKQKAKKQAEREYIVAWIEEFGSERLKEAFKLEIPYTNLFWDEWIEYYLGKYNLFKSAEVYQVSSYNYEMPPTLEEMEKYKEMRQFVEELQLPVAITTEIQEIQVKQGEYKSDSAFACKFTIYPETGGHFIVYALLGE